MNNIDEITKLGILSCITKSKEAYWALSTKTTKTIDLILSKLGEINFSKKIHFVVANKEVYIKSLYINNGVSTIKYSSLEDSTKENEVAVYDLTLVEKIDLLDISSHVIKEIEFND